MAPGLSTSGSWDQTTIQNKLNGCSIGLKNAQVGQLRLVGVLAEPVTLDVLQRATSLLWETAADYGRAAALAAADVLIRGGIGHTLSSSKDWDTLRHSTKLQNAMREVLYQTFPVCVPSHFLGHELFTAWLKRCDEHGLLRPGMLSALSGAPPPAVAPPQASSASKQVTFASEYTMLLKGATLLQARGFLPAALDDSVYVLSSSSMSPLPTHGAGAGAGSGGSSSGSSPVLYSDCFPFESKAAFPAPAGVAVAAAISPVLLEVRDPSGGICRKNKMAWLVGALRSKPIEPLDAMTTADYLELGASVVPNGMGTTTLYECASRAVITTAYKAPAVAGAASASSSAGGAAGNSSSAGADSDVGGDAHVGASGAGKSNAKKAAASGRPPPGTPRPAPPQVAAPAAAAAAAAAAGGTRSSRSTTPRPPTPAAGRGAKRARSSSDSSSGSSRSSRSAVAPSSSSASSSAAALSLARAGVTAAAARVKAARAAALKSPYAASAPAKPASSTAAAAAAAPRAPRPAPAAAAKALGKAPKLPAAKSVKPKRPTPSARAAPAHPSAGGKFKKH